MPDPVGSEKPLTPDEKAAIGNAFDGADWMRHPEPLRVAFRAGQSSVHQRAGEGEAEQGLLTEWFLWTERADTREDAERAARSLRATFDAPVSPTLREAARWVADNWDRQATQHASMPALRAALSSRRAGEPTPEGVETALAGLVACVADLLDRQIISGWRERERIARLATDAQRTLDAARQTEGER